MKLILCRICHDVRKLLVTEQTVCQCGKSYGQYDLDGYNASIGGEAIPLGFANSSLVEAIINRPESGNGSNFIAFVIPRECPTIRIE